MRDGKFQLLGASKPCAVPAPAPTAPAVTPQHLPAGPAASLAAVADPQGRVFAQGAASPAFYQALFGAQPNASAFICVVPADQREPIAAAHPVPTACFATGTRIMTTKGEITVENLALGDEVVLAEGEPEPIIWIGYRDLDFTRHPAPETVRPIRIKPGALAMDVPERELVLSPDHALYFDGALVQVKDLVDGAVITQDWQVASARYFHVELSRHGIMLAEAAPAESYLDTGHRGIYANSAEPLILHPNLMQARREAESVAPLITGGPELAAIRTRLHARNMMLGLTLADAPYVGLAIGSTLLAPAAIAGEKFSFTLPPATRDAVLATPVFVPAQVDPASNDRRALGVAITEILADGRSIPISSVIDKADLHYQGRQDPSVWTRGAARLTIPDGTTTLTICLAAAPRLWHRRNAA